MSGLRESERQQATAPLPVRPTVLFVSRVNGDTSKASFLDFMRSGDLSTYCVRSSTLTLHSCPPPKVALARWLTEYPSEVDNYGHLLLEQDCACDNDLIADLTAYFESAHADARICC